MTTSSSYLSKKDLEKTAHLARLKLTKQELDIYSSQISAIFNYLEIIKTIKLPDNNLQNISQMQDNNFREDIVQPSLPKVALLSTANSDGNYVVAPQTIHKE